MAYYLALPVLTALCGLPKKKAPVCLLCGVLMFSFLMLAPPVNSAVIGVYELLPQYPVSLVNRLDAPIGFLFPAKLLSMLFPSPTAMTAVLSAAFSLGVTIYLYRSCEAPAFAALLASAGGFLLIAVSDPYLFAAMLIAAYAFRYAAERRFLRFAALILLAACFRIDALLFLLLYFILILPPGIPLLLGGSAASAALLLTGVSDPLFEYMCAELPEFARAGFSPAIPVVLGGSCLLSGLMKRMLPKNREREYETMLTLLFAAAFLSLIGVYDPRFCPLALMAAFPAVLTLGGALLKILDRLIVLTFRERKKPVRIVCAVLGLAHLSGWYLWLLYENGILFVAWGVIQT